MADYHKGHLLQRKSYPKRSLHMPFFFVCTSSLPIRGTPNRRLWRYFFFITVLRIIIHRPHRPSPLSQSQLRDIFCHRAKLNQDILRSLCYFLERASGRPSLLISLDQVAWDYCPKTRSFPLSLFPLSPLSPELTRRHDEKYENPPRSMHEIPHTYYIPYIMYPSRNWLRWQVQITGNR